MLRVSVRSLPIHIASGCIRTAGMRPILNVDPGAALLAAVAISVHDSIGTSTVTAGPTATACRLPPCAARSTTICTRTSSSAPSSAHESACAARSLLGGSSYPAPGTGAAAVGKPHCTGGQEAGAYFALPRCWAWTLSPMRSHRIPRDAKRITQRDSDSDSGCLFCARRSMRHVGRRSFGCAIVVLDFGGANGSARVAFVAEPIRAASQGQGACTSSTVADAPPRAPRAHAAYVEVHATSRHARRAPIHAAYGTAYNPLNMLETTRCLSSSAFPFHRSVILMS
ncbi:hypothetical protein FB451DRAFT_1529656 [Mycena latifolia]|nr:hypothetical protein FB451DRAFT_1529656 [Mycena latifolia]